MAERKRFLLRVDPAVYAAVEKWAADDLRSVNAQIEYLLKEALGRAGREPSGAGRPGVGGAAAAGAGSEDGGSADPDGPDGTPGGVRDD